jgi:hypothetical protein
VIAQAQSMLAVARAIDEDVSGDHSLRKLAALTSMSPFHFIRCVWPRVEYLVSLSFVDLLTFEDLRKSDEYSITRLGNSNAEKPIVRGTHLQIRRGVSWVVEVIET